ncbi:MAG: DUF2785 domain-containing protein [Vicinamibacterales bacterium]
MRWPLGAVVTGLVLAAGPVARPAAQAPAPAATLLAQLPLLASPDPAERDDTAYGTAERLIIREDAVPADGLRQVMRAWLANLDSGLGERGTDSVFRRSFSALCLSLVAAEDLRHPFLAQAEFDAFLDRTLAYFAAERDLRGFDPVKGWMHSVAHTADVLKFLGRSEKLKAADPGRIVEAVAGKIEAAPEVFVWGEDERLAAALRSLVVRPGADTAALEGWVAGWPARHAALWASGPMVDPAAFVRVQNARQVMRALAVSLPPGGDVPPAAARLRDGLLAALGQMR